MYVGFRESSLILFDFPLAKRTSERESEQIFWLIRLNMAAWQPKVLRNPQIFDDFLRAKYHHENFFHPLEHKQKVENWFLSLGNFFEVSRQSALLRGRTHDKFSREITI